MKPAIQSILLRTIFVAALPLCFASFMVAAPAAHAKTEDPFLNGAPFTFEQLLKLAGQDAIPLHRRKEAVLSRGIDFSLTSDEADKLKAAGAPEELLKAIRSKSKPVALAAPPPPKKDPLGALSASCAPAECAIALNGTALGSTKDGKMEMGKLRPGKWVIDFSEDGYISHQMAVTVEADHTVPVAVVLEPNRATLESFGAGLFKKVVQAVAGEDGLREATSVQAIGSLTIWSREGSSVRWTLLMRNNPDR